MLRYTDEEQTAQRFLPLFFRTPALAVSDNEFRPLQAGYSGRSQRVASAELHNTRFPGDSHAAAGRAGLRSPR